MAQAGEDLGHFLRWPEPQLDSRYLIHPGVHCISFRSKAEALLKERASPKALRRHCRYHSLQLDSNLHSVLWVAIPGFENLLSWDSEVLMVVHLQQQANELALLALISFLHVIVPTCK